MQISRSDTFRPASSRREAAWPTSTRAPDASDKVVLAGALENEDEAVGVSKNSAARNMVIERRLLLDEMVFFGSI